MNVKELIEALKDLPPELPVTASGELGDALLSYLEVTEERYLVGPGEEVIGPHLSLVPVV